MKKGIAALKNIEFSKLISYGGLIFFFLLFTLLLGKTFLSWVNLSSIIDQAFTVYMLGLGALFVFGYGGTNLAVNGGYGFAAMCLAICYSSFGHPLLALPIALIVATICMYLVGCFIAATNMNAFVCTMCVNNIFLGILKVIVSSKPIGTPQEFATVIDNPVFKLGSMIVFGIITWYVLERTRIGKNVKAIGSNELCAGQSGVNTARFKRIAFICSGISVGLAAFFYAARVNAISAYTGSGASMEIIVMAVLGGLSLKGGSKTSLRSVFVGAFTLSILGNGLVCLGCNAGTVQMIKGIAFLAIILFTYERADDFVYS